MNEVERFYGGWESLDDYSDWVGRAEEATMVQLHQMALISVERHWQLLVAIVVGNQK